MRVAALLSLLFCRVALGATPEECAAMEDGGRLDVTCFGATPAAGDNDTDAVFKALCHLWRGHTDIESKTLYFPAGEYRVNLLFGWDGSLSTSPRDFTVEGDGRDDSVLVKDLTVDVHTGTWTGDVHSLDPALCTGAWVHDWDVNSHATPRRERIFFFLASAPRPPSVHFRDITVTRAGRVYPYDDPQADEAFAFDSSGALTFERTKVANFFAGARLDYGPDGTFSTPQPRPQRLVALDTVWEDMIRPINGDGSYDVRGSAFRRIGADGIGYAIYVKRVHRVIVENCTFADGVGYVLVLDNDHATGSEPAFFWKNSRVSFQHNAVTGHLGGDLLLHTVNNRLAWTVRNNSFAGTGYLKWYGRADVTFADNTADGIGVFFNWEPRPGTIMRPVVTGNRLTHSRLYARTEGLTLTGNSLSATGQDVSTVETLSSGGNIDTGSTVPAIGATVSLRWDGQNFVTP